MRNLLSLLLGAALLVACMGAPVFAKEEEKAAEPAMAQEENADGIFYEYTDTVFETMAAILVEKENPEVNADENPEEYDKLVEERKKELEQLSEDELKELMNSMTEEDIAQILAALLGGFGDSISDEDVEGIIDDFADALEAINEKDIDELVSSVDTDELASLLEEIGNGLGKVFEDVPEEEMEDFVNNYSEDYARFFNDLLVAFGKTA